MFLICDLMLSGPNVSLHSPWPKITSLGGNWLLGYAGDPGHLNALRNGIVAANNPANSTADFVNLVKTTYQDYRERQVTDLYLSHFKISLSDFRQHGLILFGRRKFGELAQLIEDFDLGIRLLLIGFSPNTKWDVRITAVHNPGRTTDHVLSGVHAIGSGAPIALGHLYASFNPNGSLEEAQYRMLEAKFMAEAERSVGPDTMLATLHQDGRVDLMGNDACEKIRTIWKKRRNTCPSSATGILGKWNASGNLTVVQPIGKTS